MRASTATSAGKVAQRPLPVLIPGADRTVPRRPARTTGTASLKPWLHALPPQAGHRPASDPAVCAPAWRCSPRAGAGDWRGAARRPRAAARAARRLWRAPNGQAAPASRRPSEDYTRAARRPRGSGALVTAWAAGCPAAWRPPGGDSCRHRSASATAATAPVADVVFIYQDS